MALPITFEHVDKRYALKSGASLTALSDATLSLREGTFTTIVGPSGCGKSTLLHIAAGLVPYEEGSVRIGDEFVERPNPNVGMMFQSPVMLPWRTVIKNLMLPFELLKLSDEKAYRERAHRMLSTVGIDQFADAYPRELSGGMQQRAALARVLLTSPQVLLLDEPFSALDEFTRESLNMELLSLWAELLPTVCLVTHNISEAVMLSDTIVVMSARPGRIIGEIEVPLPRPRTLEMATEPEFQEIVVEVRDLMRGSSVPAPQGGR
ncbi:ABC transporter ATP-binding protein [Conexibacter sp. CPCC 206217]|uniref:ABC transporter ATP-binding protein n=1 Tax=Conexibacter sp. CPCC 206217 TaxID=3064574 RepID=UPI00271A1281|nr:ABC transporter ATP-binding protein [Conexibacter sp. CPCC 206217]MDO8211698.1 ABC transporter ATP-binding protein [Conexibacter sp. CPCC 206217]